MNGKKLPFLVARGLLCSLAFPVHMIRGPSFLTYALSFFPGEHTYLCPLWKKPLTGAVIFLAGLLGGRLGGWTEGLGELQEAAVSHALLAKDFTFLNTSTTGPGTLGKTRLTQGRKGVCWTIVFHVSLGWVKTCAAMTQSTNQNDCVCSLNWIFLLRSTFSPPLIPGI